MSLRNRNNIYCCNLPSLLFSQHVDYCLYHNFSGSSTQQTQAPSGGDEKTTAPPGGDEQTQAPDNQQTEAPGDKQTEAPDKGSHQTEPLVLLIAVMILLVFTANIW